MDHFNVKYKIISNTTFFFAFLVSSNQQQPNQIQTNNNSNLNQSNLKFKSDHSLSYITNSSKSEMVNEFIWNDRVMSQWYNIESISI